MNIEELRKSGRIIFECVSGSHLYNTNIATSDEDIRGVYLNPSTEYMGLNEPADQINDEKNDTVYYSLKRFFALLQTANPNIIELIFVPPEYATIWTPVWQKIYDNRHMFVTQKAFYTHSAYAIAQVGKAKGCNKRVHNPQPETMPSKEDFCWIIDMEEPHNLSYSWKKMIYEMEMHEGLDMDKDFPFRPVPLKSTGLNLEHFHLSSLEHVPNVYRMYEYGEGSKGVFRGDQMLCCESIPMDDEAKKFRGLLIYNKEEFERGVKEWHQYWDWMKNRNESRWVDQESGKLNYDQKNMCHCMRLILSCVNILKNGAPIVRFEGEARDYLMKIRAGELTYEQIMKDAETKKAELEELMKTTFLPHHADIEAIDKLYRKVSRDSF